MSGLLTPLQLIAGASLLQNQGLSVSPELTAAINAYTSTPLITAFLLAQGLDSGLDTLAASSVPAFSNSLPAAYANIGTQMTTAISSQALADFGSGDISKFVQAINQTLAYTESTNLFINSAVNSQTYLGNTFTSFNDMITGDVTTINLATVSFGSDLKNLGNLIDLNQLEDLGTPLALIQRIVELTGNIPVLSLLLLAEGVSEDIVLNLTNPGVAVTDSVQRLMYQVMTKVTGSDLQQILDVLKISTVGISTMADLLNPVRIFPNSYLSMTVTTSVGVRAIYINNSGAVNTDLEQVLPAYVIANYRRLAQIIPADQALANKALAVSLAQVNGIGSIDLPVFGTSVANLETTRDLPLISALTEAVPASVANYYTSTLAVGTGTNGDVLITDVLGLAAGWVAAEAFANTVELFDQMDLTQLTLIYDTMYQALNGNYGLIDSGPLTIPGGRPCAGTYLGVPDPSPPDYNPTAADLAIACLTGAALAEIANLQALYPTQTNELNTLWNSMAQQIATEDTLQSLINLDFADFAPNDRNSIYSFIYSLPTYGTETEQGGMAWFIEAMADITTLGGQAIVACLREGRNQAFLTTSGIYTNSTIPSEAIPPPPQANLIPSTYTEAEASNLIIR